MARSRSNHRRHFGRHRHQTVGDATRCPHELDVDGTARAPGDPHHRRLPGVSSPIRRLTLSRTFHPVSQQELGILSQRWTWIGSSDFDHHSVLMGRI